MTPSQRVKIIFLSIIICGSNAGSNRIGIGHNVVVGTDNTTVIGGASQTLVYKW